MTHPARPEVRMYGGRLIGWGDVCLDCGKPVRRMSALHTFWHTAGTPAPDDPRRGPRRPEWNRAISDGMKAANARRKEVNR